MNAEPSHPTEPTGTGRAETASALARETAKRLRRKRIVLALLMLVFVCAVDALFIEPYWIQVTHYRITAPVNEPLKIAQIADIHTHGIGRREREMFRVLAAEKPDVIVVLGDTLGEKYNGYQWCADVYKRLHARLGVWVVRGNWENQTPLRHERAFYQENGVHLLLNQSDQIRPGVWLVGLDDPYSGTARPVAAMAGIPPGAFKIALFHSPAYFDYMAGHVNLCLTGHTHGGQVRIPFLPPLWLPRGCGRFVEGWYSEHGSRMYVTRGVGMSFLPIRFFCRPEITFITLEPEKSPGNAALTATQEEE